MNKILMSLLFGAFILTGTSFAQDQTPAPDAAAAATTAHHERKAGRHTELHKAMHKLREAKDDLQKSAKDYGGHRNAAVGFIDQALAELKAGAESEKK
jgi:hypothetical protein